MVWSELLQATEVPLFSPGSKSVPMNTFPSCKVWHVDLFPSERGVRGVTRLKLYLEQLIHIHKSLVNTPFTRLFPSVI